MHIKNNISRKAKITDNLIILNEESSKINLFPRGHVAPAIWIGRQKKIAVGFNSDKKGDYQRQHQLFEFQNTSRQCASTA